MTGSPFVADRSNYSIWPSDYRASRGLQAGIDGLALERENAKHAFVAPPKRFAVNETLERFDPERELAQSERARPLVFRASMHRIGQ
jgi:hypothetical protein